MNVEQLTSLCLESCFHLGQIFPTLFPKTSSNAQPLLPQLRVFKLRQEDVEDTFRDSLARFLRSFKGLVHVAVLLEGPALYLPPDCVVQNHGSTLRTLVWDQRRERRNKVDKSTNTADSSNLYICLNTICKGCPELRELGIALESLGGFNYLVCN